jgi:hypothetical protein
MGFNLTFKGLMYPLFYKVRFVLTSVNIIYFVEIVMRDPVWLIPHVQIYTPTTYYFSARNHKGEPG